MLLFDPLRPFLKLLRCIALVILTSGQGVHAQGTGGIPTVSVAYVTWDAVPSAEVVGYIVYYGTESGNYTHTIDVASATSAFIPDLIPGTSNFCAVTAYDAGRLESDFSDEVSFILSTAPEQREGFLIFLEAEDGERVEPMYLGVEFVPPNYLEPSLSFVTPGGLTQEGTVTLTFDAPETADHYGWARVKGPDSARDSFFVSVDGGLEHVFGVYGDASPSEIIYSNAWRWSRILLPYSESNALPLTDGTHTLAFRNREPGAALDCVVLSTDPDFTPSDTILGGGDVVAITAQPQDQSVSEGASTTLQVKAAATGPISYQWEKDGAMIPGATAPALEISNVQALDSGIYAVVVSAGSASTASDAAHLDIALSLARIESFELLSTGGIISVSLETDAPLDSTIEIYTSSDLENWTLLGSQLNTTGTIVLGDPEAAGEPKRFYRLEVQ